MASSRLSKVKRLRIFELIALVIAGAIIGYVAGHFRLGWLEEEHGLQQTQLESLYARVDQMEYQINILQVELDVERRANQSLQREISTLLDDKEQISRELSFYQRVVSTDLEDGAGIAVDRLQVIPLAEPNRFRIRLVLMQQGQIHEQVTGQLALTLTVEHPDGPVEVDLFELMESPEMSRNYRMSYYAVKEANFTLPESMTPAALKLHVRDNRGQEHDVMMAWHDILVERLE